MSLNIKNVFLIVIFSIMSVEYLTAQQDPVLMCINGKDILRSEFECQYNKTLALPEEKKETVKDFLKQFVDFKLKVFAAEKAGMDTTRAFSTELSEYRQQLSRSYFANEISSSAPIRSMYDKARINNRSGEVLVSHIFRRLPQNVSRAVLEKSQQQMDSIYNLLKNNDRDFKYCVNAFSDDKKTFWVSWLQMPSEFEDIVFALKPGTFSAPFFTPQGIHIVKVLDRKELPPFDDMKDEISLRALQYNSLGRGEMIELLKKRCDYIPYNDAIDELLNKGATNKRLFKLGNKEYGGNLFARFASTYPGGTRNQFDNFVAKSLFDYDSERLEQNNSNFQLLMRECREGMLLFAISDRMIWKPASDENKLKAYFTSHTSDYSWKSTRYRGIVLHCSTKKVRQKARKLLKSLPESEWQNALRLMFNTTDIQVQSEQGVFKPGDNVFIDEEIFKRGKSTPLTSFRFTAVLGEKVKGPEGYAEVREEVISDYQRKLENQWMLQLQANSKVEIKQEVLKTVNNH